MSSHWKARDEWGFDGYVTSDCDADSDVVFSHHYTNTPEQGVQDVLRAGTDVDCGGFVGQYAQSALNKSYITMKDIDDRLKMLFRVRMRLGHFDPPGNRSSTSRLGPLNTVARASCLRVRSACCVRCADVRAHR